MNIRGMPLGNKSLTATIGVMVAMLFVFDIVTPLGVAAGIPYIIVVLLSLRMPDTRFTIVVSVICSLLVIIGFYFSSETDELWKALVNRVLAISVFWIITLIGWNTAHHERFAQSILQTAVDAIIIINNKGEILDFNAAAERMFGYRKHELMGKNVKLLMPEPYRDQHDNNLENYLKTGNSGIIGIGRELEGMRKDGTVFPLDLSLGEIVINNQKMFTGIIRDITRRKQDEERLIKSEAQLRKAQHIAGLGFWDIDLKTSVGTNSDEVWTIIGEERRKEPFMFEDYIATVHPEDQAAVRKHVENCLEAEAEYRFDFRIIRPDGGIRHLQSTAEVARDDNGQPERLFGAVHDVTELRRHRDHLEELVKERTNELHRAQADLLKQERMATLGKLTATVSHELRNPLSIMYTTIDFLQMQLQQFSPATTSAFKRLERAVERCDRIIDELLDYTRLQIKHQEEIELNSYLSGFLLEHNIPDDIAVQEEWGADAATIHIDVDLFRRALVNVVDNACQALTEIDGEKKLRLTSGIDGDWYRVNVIDNGPGIETGKLEKIFEPLYSTKPFGVGLGLPIVQQIMQQLDGRVEVKSEPGQGTQVSLCLPQNGKLAAA